MEYHIIVINIFLIFALILVGFVAGKAHLVSEQASKDLSAILVEITLPASIFSSMLRELETDLLINAALLFFIGFACLALEYGAGRLLVKFFRIRKENQGLFLYNSMFTNASFMGFPVANAIFGSVGVFLASIVNLSLTEDGRSLLRKAPELSRGLLPEALSQMKSDDLDQLGKSLDILLHTISQVDEESALQPLSFTM